MPTSVLPIPAIPGALSRRLLLSHRLLLPLTAAALALLTNLASADTLRRPYIVQLSDKPLASYTGGISGIGATQPLRGARLDLSTQNAQQYTAYLASRQASVQAIIGTAPVLYQFKVALNGFAVLLTDAEVRQLKASSGVAHIEADQPRQPDTNYTPTFLGLDQPGGLWSQLGGTPHAGEDVIIGIVDGGVWPEHPAYADRVDAQGAPTFDPAGTLAYGAAPAGWSGTCSSGEGFTAADCNHKLIGAQYFDAGYRASGNVTHWSEFVSPRDSVGGNAGHGGHGSHTSSTAGGNHNVAASVAGIPMGAASGMAPRARLAIYKVCWSYVQPSDPTGAENRCWGADSVKAIDQAVQDGVDVLNFSISGGGTIVDAVEQAFLNAANAGVFVATSAGNSGPANSVAHVSPWLATVAAATHNRAMLATLTLADKRSYQGASLNNTPLPQAPLIRAEDAGVAGANPARLKLCYSSAGNGGLALLDPAKVGGKIVTCSRGENARIDKSLAVLQAGGAGMVLIDTGDGLVADVHSVPTVHVTRDDGALIAAYAQTSGAGAAISRFVITHSAAPAPMVAAFSSRGPNQFDPNVLKPDLAAPGVDILAAVTPELTPAQRDAVADGTLAGPTDWAFYQGTSMASPHVAGLAALLRQLHPDWSPAAIKSALMTTGARTVADSQSGQAAGQLPWGEGAGQVTPNSAADPGLVYDLGAADYKKYQCGAGVSTECSSGTLTGYNLNLPSITVANVLGTQVVSRRVTNVGASGATYRDSISVPGFTAEVVPATLTLAPGATQSFTVRLTRAGAGTNVWQFGALVWSDGSHTVRSPVSARSAAALTAPALVSADTVSGSRVLGVGTGFAGRMTAQQGGLKEVSRGALTVAQGPPGAFDSDALITAACNAGISGVRVLPFTFPANTVAARFETFNRDSAGGAADDIDLALLRGGTLVAISGHGGSDEAITLASPAAGAYTLCVMGYALANGVSTDFTLSSVVVGRADSGGKLQVLTPTQVYAAGTASVGVSWSGLASGKRYLGGVQLLDQNGALAATTLLNVETDDPLPLAAAVQRAPRSVGAQ